MALFKHLLPRRSLRGGCEKRVSPSNDEHNNRGEFETPLFGDLCYKREYTLTKNDLRLVIISENERRLLYDSETVQLAKSGDVASSTPSSCGQFLFLRHRSDISAIGQMMFGSMASTKTDSFKIHHLSVGNRLLLSRVINVPKSSKSLSSECRNLIDNISCGECDSPYSTIRSLEGMRERKHRLSKSTEPPDGFTRSRNSSLQLDNEDISSVCFDKERAFSPNKLSKTRRIILSQKADLCDENNSGRWSSRSRLSSCSSVTDDDVRQVAIGLLFNESERNFVLQHLALLETEIVKLEAQLIKASLSKTRFIHIIYQAWMEFIRSVCLLYNSPRLLNPVWLSLLRDETYDDAAASFCSHLASLIRSLDSKTTGLYVLSTARRY
ncbi:hypothetical protein AB6A40_008807 [Gnathostoma spinigerum]|uniref:Folliculin-interacting protein middle domain-containing protein n=1 Tax=Gnathostoma spinigerum TaxID=75299 RepID=A0ABD6EQG6_9BILA